MNLDNLDKICHVGQDVHFVTAYDVRTYVASTEVIIVMRMKDFRSRLDHMYVPHHKVLTALSGLIAGHHRRRRIPCCTSSYKDENVA